MNFKILAAFLVTFEFICATPNDSDEESAENVSIYSGSPFTLEKAASSHPQRKAAYNPSASSYEDYRNDEDDSREAVRTSPSQNTSPYLLQHNYPSLLINNQIPISQPKQQQPKQVQQYIQQAPPKSRAKSQPPKSQSQFKKINNKKLLEEEEEQLPDRLTELLPKSNFNCVDKKTGYYADESLGCEVFHYCQENARHSWICPEGFTFHQVHLICMPPSKENICTQSSRFHIVNDYLYKPINLEEHQNRPNVTLRYSERYYPQEFHNNYHSENDYDEEPHQRASTPVRQPAKQHFTQVVRRPTQAPQFQATLRPQTNIGQVFRSPEEVNIPLEQRRPPQYFSQRYLLPE